MTVPTLAGRRVLVVGGSAGIGQAFAVRAGQAGAKLAVVGRRADRLDETVDRAGGGGTAIVADLRDADDCARVGAEAAAALGTIDLVFIAAGAAALRWVDEATAADWAVAFETNVIGVNLVIKALCPALEPGTIVAACSSESVGHPHSGLVPYGASKAALEESLRGWRIEHPEFRFSCVAVGATVPTDFGTSFDPDTLTRAMELWARHGLARADIMKTDEVAEVLVGTFGIAAAYPGVGIEHLTVRSPAGVIGGTEGMRAAAAENGLTL
jgi:NAD(P)-dependent dehydrogenase (short-subunit alcohol dehydrogenase family)